MSNLNSEVPDIHIHSENRIKRAKSVSSGSGSGSDSDNDDKPPKLDSKIRLIPRVLKHKHESSYDSVSSNAEDDEVQLTDELREQIINQAEYYFSDENLSRDGFLLKHVKRNKEGFVNLKLLASFKKMRSLSRDYRVIGESLKSSTKLIVNETGLKIRRVDPLPGELLDQTRVTNLVISNMPDENPSMDYVIAAFPGHKDDVISVRVVKPGKKFPNDLQSHFSRHSELKDQIVAVVEFDSPENAAAAIKHVDKDKYPGIDVKLLELGPKQAKRMSTHSDSAASDTPIESDSGGLGRRTRTRKKTGNRLLEVNRNEDSYSSYASSSDSDWSSFSSCSKRYSRSHGSKSSSPSTSPKCRSHMEKMNNNNVPSGKSTNSESPGPHKKMSDNSPIRKMSPLVASENPRSSPEVSRKQQGKKNSDEKGRHDKGRHEKAGHEKAGHLSPWMTQRMQLSKAGSDSDTGMQQKHLEIIRQPRGPDGSYGFSNHPLKKFVLVHAY